MKPKRKQRQSTPLVSQWPLMPLPQVHVFLASKTSSWIIDSRASIHMTSTPSFISPLTSTTSLPPVSIVDGHSCSIKGHRLTKPTSSFPLHDVFYVPYFLVSLLSIHIITHSFNCSVTFFSFYCIFQDIYTRCKISLGYDNRCDIY